MLALSQTAGYAILALACLDEPGGTWKLAKEIAVEIDMPAPYLSKILHSLALAQVIRAKRGYRGGFTLARPAATISVLEVVEAVDDRRWIGKCLLGLSECTDERGCPTHAFWKAARAEIERRLRRLTLVEVAKFEQGFRASRRAGCGAAESSVGLTPLMIERTRKGKPKVESNQPPFAKASKGSSRKSRPATKRPSNRK